MPRSGGCLCGGIRYTAELRGHAVGACHCIMCRRWSGGPLMAIGADDIRWQGEPSVFGSSDWAERGFCAACGSSLFYRFTAGKHAGLTLLAAGSLDDWDGLILDHEVFIDQRPAAYCFAGELRGLTGEQLRASES
ncbi:MAG: GFA family protein [Deltaproteobacteria bacterium]|nr:MAG: GFA family protein [Deltaproteobacteria bacterium]